jgi:hypothetical protein
MASGRSSACRMVMAGKFRMLDSSLIVPESDMAHLALIYKTLFSKTKKYNNCELGRL